MTDELHSLELSIKLRPCIVANKDTGEMEPAIFHRWFIPNNGVGFPMALVQLENGNIISVGYRRIVMIQDEDDHEMFEYAKYFMERK